MFSSRQKETTTTSKLTLFLRSRKPISDNAPKLTSFLENHRLKNKTPKLNAFLDQISESRSTKIGAPKLRAFLEKHNRSKLDAPKLRAFLTRTSYTPSPLRSSTTHVVSIVDALRYMMNVVVTKENIKRLAVGLAITTIVTVAASAAVGGAIGSGLWSFATFLASTSSAKAGVALATKKLKFLNRRIPSTFLSEWSEKLGMPLTRNSTYADILEASINSSATIATGGIYGLFISQGLKTSMALGKTAYNKITNEVREARELRARDVPELSSLPEKVIRTMADPKIEKVNLIDLAVSESEKVIEAEAAPKIASKTSRPNRRPAAKTPTRRETRKAQATEEIFERTDLRRRARSIDQSTVEVVSKGRLATYAAGLSTVLVGLAITGTIDTALLSSAALGAANLAKEQSIAQDMIAKLVATAGVGKVAEILGLTPDQASSLKSLSKKFSKGGDATLVGKILSLVTKGKIYGSTLKSLSKAELLEVAKDRGVKVSKNVDLDSLRRAILQAEASALAQTQVMVQTLFTGAMVSAAGSQLANGSLDLLRNTEMVNPVGVPAVVPPDPSFDAAKVQKDIDFLEQTIRSGADVRLDAALSAELSLEQTALAAKAAAEAKVAAALAEKLAKDAGIAERAASRATNANLDEVARKAARAAARAEIDAARAAAAAKVAARPPKPVLESREIRESAARARRELLEATSALQNAVENNVIIVPLEGPAIGITDSKLLEPEVQKALEDFGTITPLANLAATKVAALGASWMEGGITQSINNWLGVAEFSKDVYRLTKVIQDIRTGEDNFVAVPDALNEALKLRVPSLGMVVEKMIKADDVDPKTVLLNALRDQAIHGPDLERLYMDVGRQLLWGNDTSKGTGLSDWAVRKVGSMFYHGIMG